MKMRSFTLAAVALAALLAGGRTAWAPPDPLEAALESTGTSIYRYGESIPRELRRFCNHRYVPSAVFVTGSGGKAAIIECASEIEPWVLSHEAVHAVQWCASGRPYNPFKVVSFGAPLTVEGIVFVAAHYDPDDPFLAIEMEAQSVAMSHSQEEVARMVWQVCGNRY
jgi:hypothetical protein